MIRTLHWYISRELVKVTFLALIAFTLVMTVFAIIEPLRKQGLSSDQVISLFGYTLPVMLSLTLPVAALFAATIVYGRFSQDNELMACRASGISTVSLLKPAMALGAVVTAASLSLSNFVAPKLAAMGAKAVRENVRNIAYHQLRGQSYIKFGSYLVHADAVDSDANTLIGVAAADFKKPDDARLLVASSAKVDFYEREGDWYIRIRLTDPAGTQVSRDDITDMKAFSLESLPLPSNVTRERVSVYDWDRLVRTLQEPYNHPDVQRALKKIRRRIFHGMLAAEVAAAINAGLPYQRLSDGHDVYRVNAAGAEADDHGGVRLKSGGPSQRVAVTVLRDGNEVQTYTADSGAIETTWSAMSNASLVTIWLRDNVTVRLPGESKPQPRRRGQWMVGQIEVPQDLARRAQEISLDSIYHRRSDLPADKAVLDEIDDLRTNGIREVQGDVIAEIHGRIAYGVSCFLLVAMGAALGLVFRGGQVVSAFAISVVPAAVVIVMIIMGKQMVSNPQVEMIYGLAAIWGGIAMLVGANVAVYAHLVRR